MVQFCDSFQFYHFLIGALREILPLISADVYTTARLAKMILQIDKLG